MPAWTSPTRPRRSASPAEPTRVLGGQPARLADWIPGHWGIQALHHLRDVTVAEDASQIRTGTAPGPWPACATLAIGVLHARGDRNIAAALGRNARDATRPRALLGISPWNRHCGTLSRPGLWADASA